MRKSIKRLIAAAAAVTLAAAVLTGCGDKQPVSTPANSASNSFGDQNPQQYKNYVESFSSEVTPFVEGELPKLLNAVATLDASNYSEWKAEYSDDLEKCEHWYSEVSSAEMFCPSTASEQHKALVTTVATIYKIIEGMQTRVEAADGGDFSQLVSKGAEYAQAAVIAEDMWTRALDDVNKAIGE